MPHPQHIWFRFIALTAAIFIRRRGIHERDLLFDTRWRDLGDVHWVMAMMKNKVPMAVFDHYTRHSRHHTTVVAQRCGPCRSNSQCAKSSLE